MIFFTPITGDEHFSVYWLSQKACVLTGAQYTKQTMQVAVSLLPLQK